MVEKGLALKVSLPLLTRNTTGAFDLLGVPSVSHRTSARRLSARCCPVALRGAVGRPVVRKEPHVWKTSCPLRPLTAACQATYYKFGTLTLLQ
jgi:hypothetical protein